MVEFAFDQPGRPGKNRFEVTTRAEGVWLVVPVHTDYGASVQRKILRPVDAVELGQALVAHGVYHLAGGA